ncbi:YbaK/prolyl-tRNA synthetase associated region [Serinicoccus hydrothermalis]|uniref:YbaK/prolyl-tRNA synthetase associated region n=1 Tax=Serinicoccus hydrothermalis TaxID=1758689 RepID=A0A1B1N8D4_9MICO|nr:YbaK/EbsC family protein [Serinicoccus hydrothermalis]ANS77686.1 YbaK/prolyl-tRNA synthetase associated region [Serinicoccus hydrothermalis]
MTLTWTPALDRPDLLAEPVRAALEGLRSDPAGTDVDAVEVAEIDPDQADTAVLVEATGWAMEDMANCIVVAGARAGEERVCAALVLGHTRADVNKTIRKALDVRKCSFMSMDDAVERTGMEYGGITPVGLPQDWPVLVDSRVLDRSQIVIGSGVRRSKLRLPGAMAAQLPGAQVVEGLALEIPA